MFTYLEKFEYPFTNNRIEGEINAQSRTMLHTHRGVPLMRRIKAVFWWCYMHSLNRLPMNKTLKAMPTDKQRAAIYKKMTTQDKMFEELPNCEDTIVWAELHLSAPYFFLWD